MRAPGPRAAPIAAAGLAAAMLGLPSEAPASLESDFPQAKIDGIDVTGAPRVRLFVSFLDKNLRPVPLDKWLVKLVVYEKPAKGKSEELFSFANGEPAFPEAVEGEPEPPIDRDDPPSVKSAGEDEGGMAVVVVAPGFGDAAFLGDLGLRVKEAVGEVFKRLGKQHRMNLVWVADRLSTWVEARGRTAELTELTPTILDQCAATELRALERHGEAPDEGAEAAAPAGDDAVCGLTTKYGDFDKIVQTTSFGGFYPHLFGLGMEMCGVPKEPRAATRVFTEGEEASAAGDLGPPALDTALRMLVEGAAPGQPKALVLVGDGRDGYVYPENECRDFVKESCRRRGLVYSAEKKCVEDDLGKLVIKSQELFRARLPAWLGLARAAGVRIFSVVLPDAKPHDRERLEILAWKTGGTARVAGEATELADKVIDVVDELSSGLVISFTDRRAVPGAERRYQVRLEGEEAAFVTPAFETTIPAVAEGASIAVSALRAKAKAKLGKWGLLGIGAAVGLLLLFLVYKIGKKLLAKGAAKGGKLAKAPKLPPGPKLPPPKLPAGLKPPPVPKAPSGLKKLGK